MHKHSTLVQLSTWNKFELLRMTVLLYKNPPPPTIPYPKKEKEKEKLKFITSPRTTLIHKMILTVCLPNAKKERKIKSRIGEKWCRPKKKNRRTNIWVESGCHDHLTWIACKKIIILKLVEAFYHLLSLDCHFCLCPINPSVRILSLRYLLEPFAACDPGNTAEITLVNACELLDIEWKASAVYFAAVDSKTVVRYTTWTGNTADSSGCYQSRSNLFRQNKLFSTQLNTPNKSFSDKIS